MPGKIETIGIVGLGYVGLPLAAAFAEAGVAVVGYDTDSSRVAMLVRGESDIEDVPSAQLQGIAERFEPTTEATALKRCDAILICVPTPLSNQREPDLSYVISSGRTIAGVLEPGQTVVLESTTYPGTTREELLPLFETDGRKVGEDFHLAFSPERIDPGRSDHTVHNTPKVIGGITDACTERAAEVYGLICEEIVPVSTPEAAELSKLLENIFRSVNIALVNELAQLTDRMGIDIWEVVDAASTKPFGFMRFEPGPGMGGHCLPIDPFYLAFKAREHDFYTEFIELAGKTNQAQPDWCVRKIGNALNCAGVPLRGSRVCVVGVAYKAGVSDIRESPALKIIEKLQRQGADVSYYDPHVPELHALGLRSEDPRESGAEFSCIVTAHPEVDHRAIVEASQLVVDFRGVTRGVDADNVVLL